MCQKFRGLSKEFAEENIISYFDFYLRYVIGINLTGVVCSLRNQNRKEYVVKVKREPWWLHFSDNCCT